MNIKALGLTAIVALAAPLSAEAATQLIPGQTYDILSDNIFQFDLTLNPLGLQDLHFIFTHTPPPQSQPAVSIQASIIGMADLPQMNFAASDLTYVPGSGFGGDIISSALFTTFPGVVLANLSTVFNATNGFTQVLNVGFGGGTGGGQISFNVQAVQAVPVPAAGLLLLTALGGLGFLSRRKTT